MSKLLINEAPLQVLPTLAVAIGLNEAIFLQQLHYWLTPTAKYKPHYREYEGISRPWIYNTYHTKEDEKGTGWQANFPFWSVRTIKRIVGSLKEKGLIIATDQFNTASSGTLDSDNLALSEGDNLALSRGGQLGTVMTETTTENTTDILENSQKSKSRYTDTQRADLNKLAPIFAKQCGDQFSKKELKNYICLGYRMVQEVCPLNIAGASSKSLQDLARASLVVEAYSNQDEILNSFKEWWYNEYWAGQKGQAPTPAQVGDTWGQFEAQRVINVPITVENGFYV
jgi:hypothetical protein